jgi:hypothetical protein
MTTTLPTPETLRSRAAAALVAADRDATNTLYDGPSKEVVHRSAVARAAYARELLTIAAQLEPAPSTAAPAEVSPPDDHAPARGDVYRHSVSGNVWVAVYVSSVSGDVYLAPSTTLPAAAWTVSPDFLAANFTRVTP